MIELLRRKTKYIITALISVILTLIIVTLVLCIDLTRLPEQLSLLRKMAMVDSVTAHNSITEYDYNFAKDYAATGYMAALTDDDYAYYLSNESQKEHKEDLNGESFGIGINIAVNPDTNYVTVVYVHNNGNAKSAGLKIGDALIKCDDEDLSKKSASEVNELIKGEDGTKRKLTILRNGKEQIITATCSDYISDSVNSRTIDNIGIIEITEFDYATTAQFEDALKQLEAKKVSGVIIDLRNNSGGTVDSCTEILDILLPKGEIIRAKYKNGDVVTLAESDDSCNNIPLTVLVNENSASASELFATAIKDFNRGKIVGTKTFGKGIMQTTFGLLDGSAVKMTVAEMIDKNSNTYHKKGVTPNVEATLDEELASKFLFLTDLQDTQLKTAIDTLKSEIK